MSIIKLSYWLIFPDSIVNVAIVVKFSNYFCFRVITKICKTGAIIYYHYFLISWIFLCNIKCVCCRTLSIVPNDISKFPSTIIIFFLCCIKTCWINFIKKSIPRIWTVWIVCNINFCVVILN